MSARLTAFILLRLRSGSWNRSWEGFCWTAADRSDDNVLVFERYAADGDSVVFAVNFSGAMRRDYPVPVRKEGVYRELLNSDDRAFGGTGILHPGECAVRTGAGGRLLRPSGLSAADGLVP